MFIVGDIAKNFFGKEFLDEIGLPIWNGLIVGHYHCRLQVIFLLMALIIMLVLM